MSENNEVKNVTVNQEQPAQAEEKQPEVTEEVKEAEIQDPKTGEPIHETVKEVSEDLTIHPLKEGEVLSRAQRDVWEARADEILDKIRPYIQHDGGDCQLLGIDEQGVAYITFLGACAGCMMAGEDFSTGIRLLLLDEFPELKEVVLVG